MRNIYDLSGLPEFFNDIAEEGLSIEKIGTIHNIDFSYIMDTSDLDVNLYLIREHNDNEEVNYQYAFSDIDNLIYQIYVNDLDMIAQNSENVDIQDFINFEINSGNVNLVSSYF